MQIQSHDTARRTGIAIAGLALAVLLAVGLAAAAATAPIAVDDPTNQTVAADLNITNVGDNTATSADINVSLETSDGTVAAEQTLSSVTAPTNDTVTFTMDTLAAGDYVVVANSSDSANVGVSVETSQITTTAPVTVEDAGNETLLVDAGFASDTDATATVVVTDETSNELLRDTITYTASEFDDNATLLTREYNATDGLADGNLTVSVETSPASAYDGAYAQVSDGSTDGLLGGTIAGQDAPVAIVGGLVVLGGLYYAREEDWI